MKNNLAIVIPAYKSDFLEDTLNSLVQQTNKNFRVYIGNDASPYDLDSIVLRYQDKLDLFYHKFESNLGALSLVEQWERCIDLTSEEWIWLFSDDDICAPDCVEMFYRVQKSSESRLFKFFTKMIDTDGNIMKLINDKTNREKKTLTPQRFISARLRQDRFRSYVVEYIFHRDLYSKDKFVNFPLAWFSDDATWLNFAIENNGIEIIPEFVFWRFSNQNISSQTTDLKTITKKLDALKLYVIWLSDQETFGRIKIIEKDLLQMVISQFKNLRPQFSASDIVSFMEKANWPVNLKAVDQVIADVNSNKFIKLLKSYLT